MNAYGKSRGTEECGVDVTGASLVAARPFWAICINQIVESVTELRRIYKKSIYVMLKILLLTQSPYPKYASDLIQERFRVT